MRSAGGKKQLRCWEVKTMASTWGLRRPTSLRDRNGQFWMLWPLTYHAGYGYRPVAGATLKVWDGEGNVYAGTIMDVRSFLIHATPRSSWL